VEFCKISWKFIAYLLKYCINIILQHLFWYLLCINIHASSLTHVSILFACIEVIAVLQYLVKYTLLNDITQNISSGWTAQWLAVVFVAFVYLYGIVKPPGKRQNLLEIYFFRVVRHPVKCFPSSQLNFNFSCPGDRPNKRRIKSLISFRYYFNYILQTYFTPLT